MKHLRLLFLAWTFLFTPSISSPDDVLYIQKLIADFSLNLDAKNFQAVDSTFLPTATFDSDTGVVTGIPAIKKFLAGIVQNNATQSTLSTQSIDLAAPFDVQGSASNASATSYLSVSYIGQGVNAGKVIVASGSFKDQLVKTGDFGIYGGWKFSSRTSRLL